VEPDDYLFIEGSNADSASKRKKPAQGELLSFWRCRESAANPSPEFP
ncbi:MAG: hypothetical protein ACI9W2_004497, partial [Gammaproteobacteria bacterium]